MEIMRHYILTSIDCIRRAYYTIIIRKAKTPFPCKHDINN